MRVTFLSLVLATCFVSEANAFAPSFPSSSFSTATSRSVISRKATIDAPTGEAAAPQQQQAPSAASPKGQQRRILGSQENLMLPRQYSPGKDVFPQMNHVSAAVLSSTPSEQVLRQSIDDAMAAHPLLRCRIEGDGEPDERIDLFQMVRKGEPTPCTFVSSSPTEFTSKDVLTVIDVLADDGRVSLDASWRTTFGKDMDDGESWCTPNEGPLWKIEFHRYAEDVSGKSCALVFSFNHAISDQSSANRLIDQIVTNMAAIEQEGSITDPAVIQDMPVSVEDSVLGLNKRWNDVELAGVSPGTIAYVAGKAAEGFKSPVILPDSEQDGSNLLSSLSIISGNAAGGTDAGSEERTSTLQFRTLSAETMASLLAQCRANGVSITNALTAAMTLTSTDFIDGGLTSSKKNDDNDENESNITPKLRNYKVLESLDLRRFGAQLDKGETVGCLAGSMDLIHGPFADHSGEALRTNPTPEGLKEFWSLAQNGLEQTNAFVESNGPNHAMRVFDFAMTIADLNNLVYLTAQSKDSKGRAYSAGVTNNGVYERQKAFERRGDKQRPMLQGTHGRYTVDDIYYGVSHARSGCLYQLSCLTLGGEMKLTLHPATPIVSEETNAKFADAFVELLEIVSSQ